MFSPGNNYFGRGFNVFSMHTIILVVDLMFSPRINYFGRGFNVFSMVVDNVFSTIFGRGFNVFSWNLMFSII